MENEATPAEWGDVMIISNIGQLVTNDPTRPGLTGVVSDAAVAIADGSVQWVGPNAEIPSEWGHLEVVDVGGAAVVPGFVDSHTHAVFAGDRSSEFEQRMSGATYEDILAEGGGIHSTVRATRAASASRLADEARARLTRMLRAGTTTVEVKTGYGLDVATERKMLDVILEIDTDLPLDVIPTLLAHVVPPEFSDDRAGYVNLWRGQMLDALAQDAIFADVFCDAVAFSVDETRAMLNAAQQRGLRSRVHADQTSYSGGTALAADIGAIAVDHLDHATDEDLKALADAGTVAVLLPGVSYAMQLPAPPGRRVWDAGVTVAIATDCNPGTAYIETMPFVVSLAVVTSGLNPDEALWAATKGGAVALGLNDRGVVATGMKADVVILDAPTHAHLAYRPDADLIAQVVKAGAFV